MPTYIVKWHVIDTSSPQARAESGVYTVEAADQLLAAEVTRAAFVVPSTNDLELYIDEVMEIA
jgi:c-di-AMP phosphodiesterase-like protein